MKKLMPENKLYWEVKGYSSEDAETMAKKHKGGRCKWNPNYWILRGYAEEQAVILANENKKTCNLKRENQITKRFNGNTEEYFKWKTEVCNLSKANMLTRMSEEEYIERKRQNGMKLNGKRFNDIQYWTNKGHTEEEAKRLVRNNNIRISKRRVEYWLDRGFSEEEAVIKVSEHQNKCSLNSFIKRYGDEIGTQKYENFVAIQRSLSKRCVDYWLKLGYSETDAIQKVSEHQSQIAKQGPTHIDFWLSRGYTAEDAETERILYIKTKFANCIEYWMDKGYSYDDAIQNVKVVQSNRGIRSILKQIKKSSSNLEVIFNDLVTHDKIWSSPIKRENGRYYFADFEFKNCYVEIYGDYWHANPNRYGPEFEIRTGLIARDIWEKDSNRLKEIKQITNKKVIVIWESEFKNLKEKINEISTYF